MEAKKKKAGKYHEVFKIDMPFEEAIKKLATTPVKKKKIKTKKK